MCSYVSSVLPRFLSYMIFSRSKSKLASKVSKQLRCRHADVGGAEDFTVSSFAGDPINDMGLLGCCSLVAWAVSEYEVDGFSFLVIYS